MQKPGIPKGTRDFGPAQMVRRQFIFNHIQQVYEAYGFRPIQTPTMENLSVLTGKYGDEGDQLLFKVLNSGDYLRKVSSEDLESGTSTMTPKISEKGLRYDLTVPFARFVVMNQNDITFPFKRYQIQPVWRADRPQKGRYREFMQCDADVIGTTSLLSEVEIISMILNVFDRLGIKEYTIKVNHRKVLQGIADAIGQSERLTDLCVAIDKLDKIGLEKVNEELLQRNFPQNAINDLQPILNLVGSTSEKFAAIQELLGGSPSGTEGIADLATIFGHTSGLNGVESHLELDIQLARGLTYYTGAIFEVKVNNVSIGSVGGGGRYDDLTGVFGLKGVSGVGFSFGVDRLYDVLTELDLFPENATIQTRAMVLFMDNEYKQYAFEIASMLRNAGINTDLYPDAAKVKKQLNYANKLNIPYVLMIGSTEYESGNITLKAMESGEQWTLPLAGIIEKLKNG